jgi:hypothetical protein
MSTINTSSAWESIKTYLTNFTHGLEAELSHIESVISTGAKKAEVASAPKVAAAAKGIEASAEKVEASAEKVEAPKVS